MPVAVKCQQCGKEDSVIPARARTYKFCSYACRGKWRSIHWTGKNHPRWGDEPRSKRCGYCGDLFEHKPPATVATFRKQKFCSRACADKGGLRYEGEAHPNYNPGSRRRNRRGKHGAWARAVISRDEGKCRHCGATEGLQAHHIKPFATHPELRWNVDNGLTLCAQCHWAVHSASEANEVNSGDTLPGQAEGNPEPSFERKFVEGVTTRGRAYRRWSGHCEWCQAFISKPWSDVKGKKHLFCSRRCAGKYNAAHRTYRPWKNPPKAVISSTSASHESDDIV